MYIHILEYRGCKKCDSYLKARGYVHTYIHRVYIESVVCASVRPCECASVGGCCAGQIHIKYYSVMPASSCHATCTEQRGKDARASQKTL